MNLKVISILGYLLAVGGAIYLAYNEYIFTENIVMITIQVLAAILMVWSRITFGLRSFHASANTTKGALITSGPYQFLRHPIYASVIYFFTASLIAFPILKVLLAIFAIFFGLLIRMILEEKFLMNAYPAYANYCKKAKRFIPYLV